MESAGPASTLFNNEANESVFFVVAHRCIFISAGRTGFSACQHTCPVLWCKVGRLYPARKTKIMCGGDYATEHAGVTVNFHFDYRL